jgi:hypothetical protein
LQFPDDFGHHSGGVWDDSRGDFLHAQALVFVLGPGVTLADHIAVVHVLTAAAFQELSAVMEKSINLQ